MSTMTAAEQTVRIELEAAPQDNLLLSHAWRFLANVSRVFEIARIGTDPSYQSYRFPRRLRLDEPLPLLPVHHGSVERLRTESPLELATAWIAVGGGIVGAIWVIVQVFERLYNLRLNREKLELEVEKLRRDLSHKGIVPDSLSQAWDLVGSRGGSQALEASMQQLAALPIRIVRAEIEVVDTQFEKETLFPVQQ